MGAPPGQIRVLPSVNPPLLFPVGFWRAATIYLQMMSDLDLLEQYAREAFAAKLEPAILLDSSWRKYLGFAGSRPSGKLGLRNLFAGAILKKELN